MSQIKDEIHGNFRIVDGISGKAIFFDGYTTQIKRKSNLAPEIRMYLQLKHGLQLQHIHGIGHLSLT